MSTPLDAIKTIQKFVKDAYKKIGQNKSSTKKFMDYEETATGAKIKVPFWFFTFEKGRGPRKSTQRSQPEETVLGEKLSAFEARLFKWMQSRGKIKPGSNKAKVNQARSLRYFINKKGTDLYRSGGKKDIYSNVINDKEIDKLTKDVSNQIGKITSDIISDLKV